MSEEKRNAWKALIRMLAERVAEDMLKDGAVPDLADIHKIKIAQDRNARGHLRSV